MVDILRLRFDHCLDQVADRNQTLHAAVFDHRQMPEASVAHQLHAALHRVRRRHRHHLGAHDPGDAGGRRCAITQHHFARVVAFRNDAEQARPIHHQHRADGLFGHQADRLDHRGIGRNREHLNLLAPKSCRTVCMARSALGLITPAYPHRTAVGINHIQRALLGLVVQAAQVFANQPQGNQLDATQK